MEIDERMDLVLEAVYRDMQVYCIAVNAGAELPAGCFAHVDDWAPDPTTGCMTFPPFGWVDWYEVAEELP